MKSSLFWDVTQCRLLISYRRFGTTNRSNFQAPSNPRKNSFLKAWPLKMGQTGLSRNAGNYQYTLCNIQEERPSNIHSDGRSKSWRFMFRSWYRSIFQAVSVWYLLSFRVMRTKALNNNNYYLRFSIPFAKHLGRNWEHANPKRMRKAKIYFLYCSAQSQKYLKR